MMPVDEYPGRDEGGANAHSIHEGPVDHAADRYRTLVELAALDKSDFDEALRRILRADARELGVDRVNCWELRLGPSTIRCVAGYLRSQDAFEAGTVVPEEQCPRYFRALAENPVILADDARTDPRTRELADDYLAPLGITSLMDVPIWVRGRLWGVICHEHVGPPRHWSHSDRDFAVSIGHIASMTIEARERAEAERTTRLSEFFMGILGHDLRTPLSTIRGSAEYLLEGGASERETLHAAQRIVRNSDRIARMVEQLLDFTQIRLGGGLPIRLEEIDLAALCERLVSDLSVGWPGRSIELRTTGNARGLWDPDRMWQMLSNLVVNALEHGAQEGPVWLSVDGTATDTVVVQVGNRGAAPVEIVPVMFDPFRRVERASRRSHGLGLGLFITREIATSHEGTISIDSREDQTVVTVRLPRRPSAPR